MTFTPLDAPFLAPASEVLESTLHNRAFRAEAHAKALVVAQAADLLHVKEAIRKAAFDETLSVRVRPRDGTVRGKTWALNVPALVADLRAAGYAVRVRGPGQRAHLEITWAPMSKTRACLWTWGVL